MDKEENYVNNNSEEDTEAVVGIKKEISDDELNDQLSKFINSDNTEHVKIYQSNEAEEISQSNDFINREKDSYIKIDQEFNRFLHNFVNIEEKKEQQKLNLKDQFFWFIMIGFLALMLTPLIIVIVGRNMSNASMIVSLITALIELVSAIIVLPKIIAEYLFNKEEDANMIQIIKNMQEYNEKNMNILKRNRKMIIRVRIT